MYPVKVGYLQMDLTDSDCKGAAECIPGNGRVSSNRCNGYIVAEGRKETLGFTSTETIEAYWGRGSWGVGNLYI